MGCLKITYNYQGEGLERSAVDFCGRLAEKRGQQKNCQNYYPFGLTFNEWSRSPENLYKYNGKEQQKETGLFDYGARYFDPALARFTTIDPLAPDYYSWSPYHYAANDPIRMVDIGGMGWGDGLREFVDDAVSTTSNFVQGAVNAVANNATTLTAYTGATMSLVERGSGNDAYQAGQVVGDVISIAVGAYEFVAGSTTAAGGAALAVAGSPTVVGAVAGAGVAAAGVTVATHGASTVVSAVNNLLNTDGSSSGQYTPKESLPRDKNGVPTPDPEATGPHTQLGTKKGRKGDYRQAREFDENGDPVKDIDFTDHGRSEHPNPHQHRYSDSQTGGTKQRGSSEPLEENN